MTDAWHLNRMNIFELLPPRAIKRFVSVGEERTFCKGASLSHSAELGEWIYILKRGRIKLSRFSDDGRELVVGVIEPGELFGEEALRSSGARSTSAEALDAVELCVLKIEDFDRLLIEYPDISVLLWRGMSRRLQSAHERMADLVFKSIAGRLAGFLLRLAERYGSRNGSKIFLNHRITHQEIANRIGSTRETVTATLNGFRRQGLLTTHGRQLTRTPESLQKIYSDNSHA